MTSVSDGTRAARPTTPAALRRTLASAEERVIERHLPPIGMGTGDIRIGLRSISERISARVALGHRPAAGSSDRPIAHALVQSYRSELMTILAERPPERVSAKDLIAVFATLDELGRSEPADATSTFGSELARSDVLQGMREIAHDMRSPLAAILLLVEPIRKGQKGPVTPVQERQLGLIYGAALSLSALTDDILDAGRHRQPYTPVERPFSISGVIEGACAVVRPIAEEKRLELRVTNPQRDARVGDSAAIQRVVLNLVTNALKYTEQGWVSVGCTELEGTLAEFWVEDTGDGIPDHALRVLVDGFHVGPANFRFSSSGLGLAICRSLLEPLGGALSVQRREGGGTRFSFVIDLPLAPGADAQGSV